MKYPMVDMMSDRELLEELVSESRKSARRQKIIIFILLAAIAAVVILAMIYVPKIMAEAEHYSEMFNKMNDKVGEFEKMVDKLPTSEEALNMIVEKLMENIKRMLNPFG
ncbi:MAG: hypothetical protein Q4D46_04955 [Erysipelotrichaceae bacterium]|nr:hypothetical protein [Solobacterium sp.]MDO4193326.1 hypothetical protein [Erysipelotrichaceae bacterium]MDO5121411.1 hypothetical protein [Erysipelotrichaceae bacterium]